MSCADAASLGENLGVERGSCGRCVSHFLRNHETLPKWLHHLTFPPAVDGVSVVPSSGPQGMWLHFELELLS